MPKRLDFTHPVRVIRDTISKEYKVSQETLAAMIGCSKTSIQQIESGKLNLSESMARRIDAALGSSLLKWVRKGSDINEFVLDESKQLRNFRLIQQHVRGNEFLSDFSKVTPLLGESVEWSGKLNAAFENTVGRIPEIFYEELLEYYDEYDAKILSKRFFQFMSLQHFCSKETETLKKACKAALVKGARLPFTWDFIEWLEKQNSRYSLGYSPYEDYFEGGKTGSLESAIGGLSDSRLAELGIRPICEEKVNSEGDIFEVILGYEGLDAN